MAALKFDHALVRRMAHFVPTQSVSNLQAEALDYILLQVMAAKGSGYTTPDEIQDQAHELFGMNFDPDEIKERLHRLSKEGKIKSARKNGYFLEPNQVAEVQEQVNALQGEENQVIDAWIEEVKSTQLDVTITDNDVLALREDLVTYVRLVYHVHGAECATFITRDDRVIQSLLESEQAKTLEQLPHRDERLNRIRAVALPLFFQNGNAKRKEYLSGMLNSSFVLMVVVGDKSLASYWRANWRNSVFYVDTNIILRIFNLQGLDRYKAAKRLVQLCNTAGVQLKVSKVTLDELTDVLHFWWQRLQEKAPPSKALAEKAYKMPTWEASIVSAYYEHIALGGNSQDFFARFTMIEAQLKAHGISVDPNDYRLELRSDPDFAELMSKYMEHTNRKDKGKDLDRAEHDVMHKLLVQRKRGATFKDPLEAKVWFLTSDGALADWEHRQSVRKGSVTTVMSTSTWLQLVRPLFARNVDDFDNMFLNLVNSPHLRAFKRISPLVADEVVSRINGYKDAPAEVACALMSNALLANKLAVSTPEEERELIELEITKLLVELKGKHEETEGQNRQLLAELETFAKAVDEVRAKLAEEVNLRNELLQMKSQDEQRLISVIGSLKSEFTETQRELHQNLDYTVAEKHRLQQALSQQEEANRILDQRLAIMSEKLDDMEQRRHRAISSTRKVLSLLLWMVSVGACLAYPWQSSTTSIKVLGMAAFVVVSVISILIAFGVQPIKNWFAANKKGQIITVVFLILLLTVVTVLRIGFGWGNLLTNAAAVFTILAVLVAKLAFK